MREDREFRRPEHGARREHFVARLRLCAARADERNGIASQRRHPLAIALRILLPEHLRRTARHGCAGEDARAFTIANLQRALLAGHDLADHAKAIRAIVRRKRVAVHHRAIHVGIKCVRLHCLAQHAIARIGERRAYGRKRCEGARNRRAGFIE